MNELRGWGFGGDLDGVFLEWFLEWRRGVVCGDRNDVNHFWVGALGVLALGIKKQIENGGQRAELGERWSERGELVWWIGEE